MATEQKGHFVGKTFSNNRSAAVARSASAGRTHGSQAVGSQRSHGSGRGSPAAGVPGGRGHSRHVAPSPRFRLAKPDLTDKTGLGTPCRHHPFRSRRIFGNP